MQIEEQHKCPYRTKEAKAELVQKLCKSKGYFFATELKPYIKDGNKKKNPWQVYANRLVEEGLAFRGEHKPQHYYPSSEAAAQAIAEKPPRKKTEFARLSKCQVVQALPTTGSPANKQGDFTHEYSRFEPSSDCINLTFGTQLTVVTAAELANGTKNPIRWRNYGVLGKMALDAFGIASPLLTELFDALDKMPSIPLTVHNLGWKFDSPALPDPSLFKDIPLRNKPLPSSFELHDGTPVTMQRFLRGSVSIQTRLTDSPISPDDMGQLMSSIRSTLPLETPARERWDITTTDAAYDIPLPATALRGFKLDEFEYNGAMLHPYRRRVNGSWHLRVESHEKPHVRLSDYPTYLEAVAKPRILGACGR